MLAVVWSRISALVLYTCTYLQYIIDTIFQTLQYRGSKACVEQCNFILDEENKQRRMVGPSYCRDAREYMLKIISYGVVRSKIGQLLVAGGMSAFRRNVY